MLTFENEVKITKIIQIASIICIQNHTISKDYKLTHLTLPKVGQVMNQDKSYK